MADIIHERITAWNQANPQAMVDEAAARAVASHEGLSGGIGDGGHAFGPWQLNDAGGVITGKFPGMPPEQINAWAWSPEGLDFAISHISSVAGGMSGGEAVQNIVKRFERPANPQAEVDKSLATLHATTQAGAPAQPQTPAPPVDSAPEAPPLPDILSGMPPPLTHPDSLNALFAQERDRGMASLMKGEVPDLLGQVGRIASMMGATNERKT
jgi:hypothetical protein